jgi:hypothetical protein
MTNHLRCCCCCWLLLLLLLLLLLTHAFLQVLDGCVRCCHCPIRTVVC